MANNQNTIDFIKSHVVKAILNQVLNYPLSCHELSILVKIEQVNNTQPEWTTHHVIYFEAYNNVIKWYKERFHQVDFEIYKHIQKLFYLTRNITKILSVYLKKCSKEILIGRT